MVEESLLDLLNEPVETACHRERNALEERLRTRDNRVVLFGGGNLGRKAAQALRSIGIDPLAFSDNNPARWNSDLLGIQVFPPKTAADLYGRNATFLVTIWNEFHWYEETRQQLESYGADQVMPYPFLHWRFPERFLPCLLNDLPHKVIEQRESVLAAADLWRDSQSQSIYHANIRLRVRGDLSGIPGRPAENTYFPEDLFSLVDTDRFLDCGATAGEMAHELFARRGDSFESFCAIEADNISFPKLQAFRDSLPLSRKSRLQLLQCAVGAERGVVHFAHSGLTGSKISAEGLPIDCYSIDELFRDTPLTFIKMDIEGAEFDALLGARKVIERDRPILAICVYHTQNDIWRIPLLIHKMLPGHRLFLRAYEGDGYQTVMYAVPPHRISPRAAITIDEHG